MNYLDRPEARTVNEAITSRRSIRAFLPDPVPREMITRILEVAGRTPSGSNIQPWNVDVVLGEALDQLTTAISDRFDAGMPATKPISITLLRGGSLIWRGGARPAGGFTLPWESKSMRKTGCVLNTGATSYSSTHLLG